MKARTVMLTILSTAVSAECTDDPQGTLATHFSLSCPVFASAVHRCDTEDLEIGGLCGYSMKTLCPKTCDACDELPASDPAPCPEPEDPCVDDPEGKLANFHTDCWALRNAGVECGPLPDLTPFGFAGETPNSLCPLTCQQCIPPVAELLENSASVPDADLADLEVQLAALSDDELERDIEELAQLIGHGQDDESLTQVMEALQTVQESRS